MQLSSSGIVYGTLSKLRLLESHERHVKIQFEGMLRTWELAARTRNPTDRVRGAQLPGTEVLSLRCILRVEHRLKP